MLCYPRACSLSFIVLPNPYVESLELIILLCHHQTQAYYLCVAS